MFINIVIILFQYRRSEIMKKFLALALVLTLILTMTVACTTDQAGFEDGTHTAEGEIDDHGWKPVIEIVVEDGQITSVDYDEYNEAGELKSEDDEYADSMEGVSGVRPVDAYEQLENNLINSQNVDQVDVVSGATASSEAFKNLANEALGN